jgi:hypothetical protein
MIHLISQKATRQQIDEMLEELAPVIKLAVDIHRQILAAAAKCMRIAKVFSLKTAVARRIFGVQIGFLPNKQSSLKRSSIFAHSDRISQ